MSRNRDEWLPGPTSGPSDGSSGGGLQEIPRLPADVHERPRALQILDARAAVTLLVAPAGMGKSTTVASWVRSPRAAGQRVVWLGVDPGTSVEMAWWTLASRLGARTAIGVLSGHEAVDEALSAAGPVVVVLDDVAAEAAELVAGLVALTGRHDGLSVIACLRRAPDPDSSGSTGSTVRLIGRRHLELDEEAALASLRQFGVTFERRLLTPLLAEIDGWPQILDRAGHLLADAAARDTSPAEAVTSVRARLRAEAGAHLDERLSEDERTVAARVSHLSCVDAGTAAHLTSDLVEDGETVFASLVAHGVLRVDDEGGSRRYVIGERHRSAARARDHRWTHRERDTLMRRVLDEACAAERWTDAFRQALEFDGPGPLIDLFERSWITISHDAALMERVLDRLPSEVLSRRPVAATARRAYLQWYGLDDQHPGRRRPLDPGLVLADVPDTPRGDLVRALLDLTVTRANGQIIESVDRIPAVVAACREVAAGASDDGRDLLASAWFQVGATLLLRGTGEGAASAFREALRWVAHDQTRLTERAAHEALALVEARHGELSIAVEWLEAPRTVPSPPVASPFERFGDLARFWVAVGGLDEEASCHWLDRLRRGPVVELWPYVLDAVVTYELLWGDPAALMAVVEHYRDDHAGFAGPGTYAERVLLRVECDIRLALGHGTAVQLLLDEAQVGETWLILRRARLALLEGRHDDVLLETLPETASARARTELAVTQAAAAVQVDANADASMHLRRAARLLYRHGLWTAIAALPVRYRDALRGTPELGGLMSQLGNRIPRIHPEAVEVVVLHERERVVLGCLVRGLTVDQTATELFVSPNTVKTQISSIYRKLDVRTRKAAVLRARELGLA